MLSLAVSLTFSNLRLDDYLESWYLESLEFSVIIKSFVKFGVIVTETPGLTNFGDRYEILEGPGGVFSSIGTV